MTRYNQHSLNAYIRIDNTDRLVPSSLIFDRNQPRSGKWLNLSLYPPYITTTPTTTLPPIPSLALEFSYIYSVVPIVGDPSNVDNWNTYFDLPAQSATGTTFDGVDVIGNTIYLYLGDAIILKANLFSDSNQIGPLLVSIVDTANCVIGAEDYVFGQSAWSWCPSLTTIDLPILLTAGDHCFYNCNNLSTFNAPLLNSAGDSCFKGTQVYNQDYLSLVSAGANCFEGLTGLTTINAPLITIGDYCFKGCTNLTDINISVPVTLGNGIFQNCTHLIGIDVSALTSAGDVCFNACSVLNPIGFPLLTTAGTSCFLNCTGLTSTTFPELITAGDNCFQLCTAFSNNDFPELTSAGTYCFNGCSSITGTLNVPVLTNYGEGTFGGCGMSALTIPQITRVYKGMLAGCLNLLSLDLSQVVEHVGETLWISFYKSHLTSIDMPLLTGVCANGTFTSAVSTTINIPLVSVSVTSSLSTLPNLTTINCASLRTIDRLDHAPNLTSIRLPLCTRVLSGFTNDYALTEIYLPICTSLGDSTGLDNVFLGISGNTIDLTIPAALVTDADVVYLQAHNTVNLIISSPAVALLYDDIINAPVIDPTDYTQWNTFFNLPANGTPFTSVEITDNVIRLIGGSGIALADSLFDDAAGSGTHLYSIYDPSGMIISAGYNTFGNQINGGCPNLGKGIYAYNNIRLPALATVGTYCFSRCTSLVSIPGVLTSIPDYCFYYCTSLVSTYTPATSIGVSSFENTAISNLSVGNAVTIGNRAFAGCTNISHIDITDCTSLGSTVGNNNVFLGIIGNIITLTVPPALMTCNTGSTPDGDLQYLIANNNVVSTPLILTFDNLTNVSDILGDITDVTIWNTYFDLPGNGTPFTNVQVNIANSRITLQNYGTTITLPDGFFDQADELGTHLIDIYDQYSIITSLGNGVFGNVNNSGCPIVTSIVLTGLITAGDYCFKNCTALTQFASGVITTLGVGCFYNCTVLADPNFSVLTSIGNYCFYNCTAFGIAYMPLLTVAPFYSFANCTNLTTFTSAFISGGDYCFANCTSLTVVSTPSAVLIGDHCFTGCTMLDIVDLTTCTNLGPTITNNNVFNGITTMTSLTVPTALMNAQGIGVPDGDIQYAIVNNPSLVITTV